MLPKNRHQIAKLITFLVIVVFCVIPFRQYAQSAITGAKQSLIDKWEGQEYLEAELSVDLSELNDNKYSEEYRPAHLSLQSLHGTTNWDIEVRTRGKHRRKICTIPPLKLKISEADLHDFGVNVNYNKYKLVTHCKEDFAQQELVLREYLTYKMYRILTDESFRVVLLKIKWNDTSGGMDISDQWAFLIEDNDELANRMNGMCATSAEYTDDIIHKESNAIHSLFQFAIGNLDWNQRMGKNVELVINNEGGKIKMVPYDFDFSAMVNPPYLRIEEKYQLDHKRDRIYTGIASEEELNNAFQLFKKKEKQLYKTIDRCKMMSFKQRKDYKKYLKSFYKQAKEELHLK